MQTLVMFLGAGASIVLLAIAAMHVVWAFGGGQSSRAVPTKDDKPLFKPTRIMTLAVAVALLVASVITIGCVGLRIPGVPGVIYKLGIWSLAGVFLARAIGEFKYVGFFKKVRDSAFAKMDTRLYTPLCALLAASFLAIALNLSN